MLLGVREARADEPVRKATYRPTSPTASTGNGVLLRRLQENLKIAGYIAADTLGRLPPGRNGRAS